MQKPLPLRLPLATLAATLAIVAWGMIFWGFLADPLGAFHALPDADAVTQALGDTPTGTYFMPWPRDTPEAFEAFVAQHQRGPFYQISFIREGVDPNSPGKLLLGVLHYLVVAALAAALGRLNPSPAWGRRAATIALAGLLGTVFINIGNPIWFHLPWDHTLATALYECGAWALLGAIIPAIDRRRPAA